MFPKAPPQIQGLSLRVEYVSPVAKAQRMTQVVGFQRLLESLGQIAQAKPEVFDRIDADGTVDFFADAYDVSYQTLTPEAEVTQIRDARAKQAAEAHANEQANIAADSAAKLGKAQQSIQTGGAGESQGSAVPTR
jgi:hypothetical protein